VIAGVQSAGQRADRTVVEQTGRAAVSALIITGLAVSRRLTIQSLPNLAAVVVPCGRDARAADLADAGGIAAVAAAMRRSTSSGRATPLKTVGNPRRLKAVSDVARNELDGPSRR